MDLLDLTARELAAFARSGGVAAGEIDAVERALAVTFPPDVRPLAAVFRGGAIGEKLHHFSWSPADPISVVERTRHFRAQGLPGDAVALAVGGRILHAMVFHTTRPMIYSWVLSADDPAQLERPVRQHYGISFFSYRGFLLDRIETLKYVPVRAALMKRFPKLTPRAAGEWRHRWAPHEAERIDDILRRGIRPTDNLPTHVVDGTEFVDLRGYVQPRYRPLPLSADGTLPPAQRPPPPWIERVDLSFAEGNFFDTHARDCLFRAARISSARGRFEHCDFTMADVQRAGSIGRECVDCDFTGAYLARVHMFGRYERCDFTGANLYLATPEIVSGGGRIDDCTLTDARVSGDFGPWIHLKYGFPLDTSDMTS
jgi:hypothetical protein